MCIYRLVVGRDGDRRNAVFCEICEASRLPQECMEAGWGADSDHRVYQNILSVR